MRYQLFNEPMGPQSEPTKPVAEADTIHPLLIIMAKMGADLILSGAFFELVINDTNDNTVYLRVRGNN